MRDNIIETMEEQKKKKWGIYRLITGSEIVSNPIYTGPQRKDLVLDIDQHNKVITRLLARAPADKGTGPTSPLPPEICEDIPWLKVPKPGRPWMDPKALRVMQTCLIYAGYFMLVSSYCKSNNNFIVASQTKRIKPRYIDLHTVEQISYEVNDVLYKRNSNSTNIYNSNTHGVSSRWD